MFLCAPGTKLVTDPGVWGRLHRRRAQHWQDVTRSPERGLSSLHLPRCGARERHRERIAWDVPNTLPFPSCCPRWWLFAPGIMTVRRRLCRELLSSSCAGGPCLVQGRFPHRVPARGSTGPPGRAGPKAWLGRWSYSCCFTPARFYLLERG